MLQIKRIYNEPATADGYRILVDRLWPRGISRERAAINLWLKDIAPSTELRQWFNHQPEKFREFSQKYTDELTLNPAMTTLLAELAAHPDTTLLYAARDPAVNHAAVLRNFLMAHHDRK